MSTLAHTVPVLGDRPASNDGRTVPGRVVVDDRVLRKVAEQAAARAIGVERGQLSAELFGYRDGIAVRVSSPLPVPDLADTAEVKASLPVPERVELAQRQIMTQLSEMIGRPVRRVDVKVTGALIEERRRVR